jgi:hypothetical protein
LIRRFGQLEPADRAEALRQSLDDGSLNGLSKLEVVEEWRWTDPDASNVATTAVVVYTVDLVVAPGGVESRASSTDASVMLGDDDR